MLTTTLRSIKEIYGYSVCAADFSAGEIKEFYVDSKQWKIASISVGRGPEPESRIQISPEVLEEIDSPQRTFFTQLTPGELEQGVFPSRVVGKKSSWLPAGKLLQYTAYASDRPLGRVTDLLVNDADLGIRYLAVRVDALDKQFLLSPWNVGALKRRPLELVLRCAFEEVCRGPEYNFSVPVSREIENLLQEQYGKPLFWV